MELAGKAALITGASRGLGEALARRLAAAGMRVVLVARGAAEIERIAAEIRAVGGFAHAVPGDVGVKEAAHRITGAAAGFAGPIDLLLHCASTLGPVPLRPLLDTGCEDLEAAFAVNVVGPFRITKIVAAAMAMRGSGTVVAISSDAAVDAHPSWGAYAASKAAFDHMMRTFDAELASRGVRFLTIDPGEMDTRMHADAVPDADRSTLARPDDVAARIVAILERPSLEAQRISAGAEALR